MNKALRIVAGMVARVARAHLAGLVMAAGPFLACLTFGADERVTLLVGGAVYSVAYLVALYK